MAQAKQLGGSTGALDVNLVTPKGVVAHEAACFFGDSNHCEPRSNC